MLFINCPTLLLSFFLSFCLPSVQTHCKIHIQSTVALLYSITYAKHVYVQYNVAEQSRSYFFQKLKIK